MGGELGKDTPLSSTGRTMALWDLKLLHVRQGTPIAGRAEYNEANPGNKDFDGH